MSRTLNVVRMQLVNRQTFIWIPLIILGGTFIVSLAIYAVVRNAGAEGPIYGFGLQAPLWYFAIAGSQALTLTFPFSQAMSVTRREFHAGTLVTACLTALILAAVLVIGGLIERATGGWGMSGHFFYLPDFWSGGAVVAGLSYFALAMLFFSSGFWGATIYKRFGATVLTTILIGLGLLLVGGMWLIGRLDAWVRVGTWLGDQGLLAISLWGLVLVAILAVISYLSLRRAVP